VTLAPDLNQLVTPSAGEGEGFASGTLAIEPTIDGPSDNPSGDVQTAPEFSPDVLADSVATGSPEIFTIDRILQRRYRRNTAEYLVRWEGYGPESDTWEPRSSFDGTAADDFDRSIDPRAQRLARRPRRSSRRTEHEA
jgi:Chromo (CHRromatin Organisation MOdifier) domain